MDFDYEFMSQKVYFICCHISIETSAIHITLLMTKHLVFIVHRSCKRHIQF